MDHPHEPIDAINDWQIWYRTNVLTDTNQLSNSMASSKSSIYAKPTWDSFYKAATALEPDKTKENVYFQKAVDHFADTLAEFANELTAEEFYQAFYRAALEASELAKEEYNKTKALVSLIKKDEKGKTN